MIIQELPGLLNTFVADILKLGKALLSFLKLKTGSYRKEPLPSYSFSNLTALWPYNPTHCVSDSFCRKKEVNIDLSVCIPAFNAEKTILTLLQQIEGQKTSFRIEVLIVNDGSMDQTGSIVEGFIAGKENYHLYHQENAGLSAARNKAIDNSSGCYLTFIDSDDEICDGYIENLMSAAVTNDADIARGHYCSKHESRLHFSGIA